MTKQLARYDSYKDSGVEWLGQIPEEWMLKKGKYIFVDYVEKNHPNDELLSVTQDQGVVPRSMVENRMVMPSGNLHTFKFIEKGDFAISLRSFEGGFEYCYHDGIISPAYTVLKSIISINNDYYKYLFKSDSFISGLQTCTVGIREGKNISYEEFAANFLPIPEHEEQQRIADFLDKKTAQIDEAIAQKEKMIELLKEYRQVTINNAVTKGLDPNIPMKDSGVEWLGEIPAHWQVKKLKYLTSFINRGITPNYTEHSEYKVVNQATFSKGFIDIDSMKFHHNKNISSTSRGVINENDLLIASTGGGVLGKVAYINIPVEKFIADSHVTIIRNNDRQSNKFLYYFYSVNFALINAILAQGSTNQTELQRDWLINMFLSSPPIEEQKQIADFLDKKTIQIDAAITFKQSEIEKLKEYKATLIDSAVIGKIKV